jgi:hypothetical protein
VNAKVLHIFCLVTCPSPVHACSRCRREMLATSEKSKKNICLRDWDKLKKDILRVVYG